VETNLLVTNPTESIMIKTPNTVLIFASLMLFVINNANIE